MPSVCCAISIGILIFYFILGILYGQLEMGTAIMMIVTAVMMQAFVHLYFSSAVKSGNFGGIAGYDSKTEYNVPEVKKLLIRIDRHIGLVSCGCMLLLFAGALGQMLLPEMGEKESAVRIVAVSAAYILEFILSIAYFNYQSIDDIFVYEIDKQRSRCGWISSAIFLFLIVAVCGECIALFIGKRIENNTEPALQCAAYIILICVIDCAALFWEQNRIKKMKSFERPYRLGKGFIAGIIVSIVFMILMAVSW